MGDLILLAVLITIVAVVSIEFGKDRKDFVRAVVVAAVITMQGASWSPAWYGYLTLTAGMASFVWAGLIYQRPDDREEVRRNLKARVALIALSGYQQLKAALVAVARASGRAFEHFVRRRQAHQPTSPVNRLRLWSQTLLLVAVSPLLAIPVMFLMVLVLWWVGVVTADGNLAGHESSALPKFLFGTTVVYWMVTLDLILRYLLVCLPLLAAAGYWGTLTAFQQRQPWRYYSLVSLALAAVYPLMFLFASLAGEFNEPFLN